MKKRPTFGVITAECYREHTAEMMSGILAQCTLADCNVIVLSAKNNFQEPVTPHNDHEAELFRLAQAPEFDGFLYDRNSFAHQGIRKHIDDLLKRTGKPVMLLDASEVPYFENTVTHDPEAFELLVEHLIQVHGYRKIYCLTGQKAFTQSAERLEAYCNVMQRHGLYYDESYYAYGDFWRDYPVEYAQRIISGALSKPEAVVCANDVMADALIAALTKAGIRVPEDIAVTGFDWNLEDAQSDVALTTCKKAMHSSEQMPSGGFTVSSRGGAAAEFRLTAAVYRSDGAAAVSPCGIGLQAAAENSVCLPTIRNGFTRAS